MVDGSRRASRSFPAGSAAPPARVPLRQKQKEQTRQALLDGAREAFEERGYLGVTIDDIAARAGTGRATFYLHFSKGRVLAELMAAAFGSERTSLFGDPTSLDTITPPELHDWIASYVHAWVANRKLAGAWIEGDMVDPEVQAITRERLARRVEAVSERIMDARRDAGDSIDRDSARARATILDVQLQYFCYEVINRGFDASVEAGIEAIAEQWRAVLFPAMEAARPAR